MDDTIDIVESDRSNNGAFKTSLYRDSKGITYFWAGCIDETEGTVDEVVMYPVMMQKEQGTA